jgi:hypothetical protein
VKFTVTFKVTFKSEFKPETPISNGPLLRLPPAALWRFSRLTWPACYQTG